MQLFLVKTKLLVSDVVQWRCECGLQSVSAQNMKTAGQVTLYPCTSRQSLQAVMTKVLVCGTFHRVGSITGNSVAEDISARIFRVVHANLSWMPYIYIYIYIYSNGSEELAPPF
jgi:hypothetical protein